MTRIGIAIGRARVWAVPGGKPLSADTVWSSARPDDDPASLGSLFVSMRDALGVASAKAEIVLLPDVCRLRHVALPRMREHERRAVLHRTLARYVPDRGPWVFGADPAPGGAVVATAGADLAAAITAAVRGAGWRLGGISAAEPAWIAATRPSSRILVVTKEYVELLDVTGTLPETRRLPRSIATPDVVGQLVAGAGGPIAVIAEPPELRALRAALTDSTLVDAAGGVAPEALAAAFAHRARPELLTDDAWVRRRVRMRRARRILLASTAVCAVLAALTTWWGTARELHSARAARALHAGRVAEALALRERVAQLEDRVAIVSGTALPARSWTGIIADVSDRLPRNAFLTAFRAAGDSISLEGYAREAAPVLDALRQAPAIAGLRATAPLRREARPDGSSLERFTIGARLAGPGEHR